MNLVAELHRIRLGHLTFVSPRILDKQMDLLGEKRSAFSVSNYQESVAISRLLITSSRAVVRHYIVKAKPIFVFTELWIDLDN